MDAKKFFFGLWRAIYYRRLCRCSQLTCAQSEFTSIQQLDHINNLGVLHYFSSYRRYQRRSVYLVRPLIIVVKLMQQETSSWPRTLEHLLTPVDSDLVLQGHPYRRYSARATDSVTCTNWHRLFHLFLHPDDSICVFLSPFHPSQDRQQNPW